jgi:hypothetical protein
VVISLLLYKHGDNKEDLEVEKERVVETKPSGLAEELDVPMVLVTKGRQWRRCPVVAQ